MVDTIGDNANNRKGKGLVDRLVLSWEGIMRTPKQFARFVPLLWAFAALIILVVLSFLNIGIGVRAASASNCCASTPTLSPTSTPTSTKTATPTATPVPFLTSGTFVIGDQNAAVGSRVTWWGSQWSKVNNVSGGKAPSSFKGFAQSLTTMPANCGGTWTTGPGNSSSAPTTVPSLMAVVVAGRINKSGSTISGDIHSIVVVQTNPGYSSDPGASGTGTVLAIVC